jgi:hypothetical protein
MERVLAADFFEFGRSGRIHDRAAILAMPGNPIDAKLPLRNFTARLVAVDVVLVTYISEVRDGKVAAGNRSSLWTRTPLGWQLRFHQGTPTLAC